ncbi:hypothetical protein U0021_06730 [Moraxella canis]|uniref:Preprotein translocase subunit YajC n=1 Tax=Moraxella canis TaxID=90239 RepID=A0ABZ0WWM7_9GAMM|nr:hypothetical protein [Moraxella canis]WQE03443.1 hypothetical protein U0021_06730 [Moraxella canis]
MFAFILNIVIIGVVMWLFFKFMYPKPPKAFFPKEGDDTSLRHCHHCGHELATYRGILLNEKQHNERFFCNDEHLSAYADAHPEEHLPSVAE